MLAVYAEWLHALEHSGLGHVARHSAWLYTASNVLHVLGAAFVVGSILVFDVALIGRRFDDAARIGRFAIPIAAGGVGLQVVTGVVLLAPEATRLGVNPAFYAKLIFIAIGLVNVAVFHALYGRKLRAGVMEEGGRGTALVSLAAWILTLGAGRMIAYL
jgi:hypothetical protein